MPEKPQAEDNCSSSEEWEFRGFLSPTTTPVPDEVFDVLAPRLKEGELRVLLYIIRRTLGWKKRYDNISLRQMVEGITTKEGQVLDEGTGLSKRAVIAAVRSLVEHKIIVATARQSPERGSMATTYSLNFLQTAELPPVLPKVTPPVLPKVTPPGDLKSPPRVTLGNPQQTVKQQTEEQQHVVVQTLTSRGMTLPTARRLASRHPAEHIEQKVELLDYLLEINSPLVKKNPAGYLRKAIEEDYQPPAGFMTRAERESQSQEQERVEQIQAEYQERHDPVARALAAHGTSTEELDLWRQVQEQLRVSLPGPTYATYFQNAVLLNLDGSRAILGFPNQYTRDWATNRLAQSLQRAFEQVLEQAVTIEATVLSPAG